MKVREISVDERNKALRKALKKTPEDQVKVVLADCGLTDEEQKCILEHRDGADLIWISGKLNMSDRTTGRRRASALNKLRVELEQ